MFEYQSHTSIENIPGMYLSKSEVFSGNERLGKPEDVTTQESMVGMQHGEVIYRLSPLINVNKNFEIY